MNECITMFQQLNGRNGRKRGRGAAQCCAASENGCGWIIKSTIGTDHRKKFFHVTDCFSHLFCLVFLELFFSVQTI
jgi:hypothetical protein